MRNSAENTADPKLLGLQDPPQQCHCRKAQPTARNGVQNGGCLTRNFGTYDESRVTILDDICATAKGYEYLALMSLKRRE